MQDIVYRSTQQGQQTRSQLLTHIQPGEELSREELIVRSGLSYEQVRRQTRNLCLEGKLRSQLREGKRWYSLPSAAPTLSNFNRALRSLNIDPS